MTSPVFTGIWGILSATGALNAQAAPDVSAKTYETSTLTVRNSKACNECGRIAPWVLTHESGTYSWRLCWKHLGNARGLVKELYSR